VKGLLDFLQAASNTAASNVTGPVDLLTLGLQKLGVPVPDDAIGSSAWARRKGLMRDVEQSGASLAGETAGLLSPIAVAAKAPQIAKGLLGVSENASTAAEGGLARGQRGMVPMKWNDAYHATTTAFDPPAFDLSKAGSKSRHASADVEGMWVTRRPEVANIFAAKEAIDKYPIQNYGNAGAGVKAIGTYGMVDGAAIMPLKAKVQNPFVVSNKEGKRLLFGSDGEDWRDAGGAFAEVARKAKESGYDAVVIRGNPMSDILELRSDQVLLFDPATQTKSKFAK
jgi:hypothetical protein